MTQTLAPYLTRLGDLMRRATGAFADLEPTFDQLALELFALQFEHNAAYRHLCANRRATPATVRHWTQIAAAPTSAFKELEMTCLRESERTTVFHSSGTTGQRPSRHFHSRESLAIYEASLVPWFQRHLLPEGNAPPRPLRFISLTPDAAAAPRSSLVHMFDSVQRALGADDSCFGGRVDGAGAWTLDAELLVETLRGARRPVLLLGTAFSFVHLADELAARSFRLGLPAGSRALETGGYKGRSRSLPKAELHALMTDRLGLVPGHIVCEYGMSELSSQAYDGGVSAACMTDEGSRVFRFPPWCRGCIVSSETGAEVADGETGRIRVVDLANVFSVLAVQTEDLGIRRGDGFEWFGRASQAEPRGCSWMTV